MNCSMPGLPVHHQLPEFTQTHIHRVSDAIQPSHPLSSPSPPAPNPSQQNKKKKKNRKKLLWKILILSLHIVYIQFFLIFYYTNTRQFHKAIFTYLSYTYTHSQIPTSKFGISTLIWLCININNLTFINKFTKLTLRLKIWRTVWRFLKKLEIELPYNPEIPLLGIHTKETRIERNMCTPMFFAALFTIARTWKQPRCPSADEWIRKLWYIHTIEY